MAEEEEEVLDNEEEAPPAEEVEDEPPAEEEFVDEEVNGDMEVDEGGEDQAEVEGEPDAEVDDAEADAVAEAEAEAEVDADAEAEAEAAPEEDGAAEEGAAEAEEDEEELTDAVERMPHSDKFVVRMRQKLWSPKRAEQFIAALGECIENNKSEGKEVTVFEDFDISQNKIPLEQLSDLFSTLSDGGVHVERLRMFGVPTFNDEAMAYMAGWLSGVGEENAPFELHLSDCAITSEGFTSLVEAIQENETFPTPDPKLPHKGKLPLYVRIEHNYIDTNLIKRQIKDGVCCQMRKSDYQQHSDTIKIRLMVIETNQFQQHSGEPPAPEDAPPPKRVYDKGKGKGSKGKSKGEKGRDSGKSWRDRDGGRSRNDRDSGKGRSRDDRESWRRNGNARDAWDTRNRGASTKADDRFRSSPYGSSRGRSDAPWQALPAPTNRNVGPPSANRAPYRRESSAPLSRRPVSPVRKAPLSRRPASPARRAPTRATQSRDAPATRAGFARDTRAAPSREDRNSRVTPRGSVSAAPYNAFARGNASRDDAGPPRAREPTRGSAAATRNTAAPTTRGTVARASGPSTRTPPRRGYEEEPLIKRPRTRGSVADERPHTRASERSSRGSSGAGDRGGRAKPAERLPHPWELHWSEEHGLNYYWNSKTGESSWEKP